MSKSAKISLVLLFILVLLSLGLNGFLMWRLLQVQEQARRFVPVARDAVSQAITELETLQTSTIRFNVAVKQDFPVKTEVPFNQTLDIPIQLTLPISQVIETTIMIDPLQSGLSIPVDVNVPVDLEVPIDLTVPVSIDQTVPISTTIPLDLEAPILIEVGETEIAGYLERLKAGLISFRQMLAEVKL